VYNPHINPETGELDLVTAYPEWNPRRHYLVTVLTYLKKIFYLKLPFPDGSVKANLPAAELARKDPRAYKKKVESCVRESQRSVYVNDPGCTVVFKEENEEHKKFKGMMADKFGGDALAVTRAQILECVNTANKKEDGEKERQEEIEGGGGGGEHWI